MNSRHPDPRRVWKGGPQQRVMTPIPGIAPDCPGLAGACSKKLVLEQHSFTFADFCCPRPPLGLLPVPVLSSENLVLERHALLLTFAVRAPPLGLLPVPVLNSEKLVLEQHSFTFADFCCPRPTTWGRSRCRLLNSKRLVLQELSFTFADF